MSLELDPDGRTPSPADGSIGRLMLRGGVWVSATQALGVACATLSQILLARLLVPEALGAFYLIQSIVVPAAQVGQLGLPSPLTRVVAQTVAGGDGDRIAGVVRAALALGLAGGSVVAMLYLASGAWLARAVFAAPLMTEGVLLAALWTLAITLQQISAAGLRGMHRVGVAAVVAESGAKILMAGGLALLLAAGGRGELATVLAVTVASVGVMALLGLGLLRPRAWLMARIERGTHATLLRASLPLVVSGVVLVALHWADLWVMGARFTPEQVALYGAAKRLIMIVSFPLMLLILVIPPVIVDLHARGEHQRLQRVIRGATTLTGIPSILILLVFMLSSEMVLGIAFGEFYRGASTVLVLLSIERLIFVSLGPCGLTLLMTGHETTLMKITTTMGFVTVGLVLTGASLFGFVGVAIGFVVGSAAHQLIAWHTVKRLVGVRTHIALGGLLDAIAAVRHALGR